MDLVRVNNTRPTLLHLPDSIVVSTDKDRGPRIAGMGTGKTLLPGGNNVDTAEWERAKGNKAVKQWLAIGWLTVGGDTEEPEGPLAPLNLRSFGNASAITMIDGEDSIEILSRWLQDEDRGDVVSALKRRIESLGKPKKGTRG